MQYGCIGEHLPHSFSKEIHAKLEDYAYELKELTPKELPSFMKAKAFSAINVTIPYKTKVIPYIDELSQTARAIGAVNTVVNRDGKLFGYNTDFGGLKALAERTGVSLAGKKVLVLGTGGTSKTAVAVSGFLGCQTVCRVSRTAREDALSYEEVYQKHTDADVVINTTPCGMFPHIDEQPISLEAFSRLSGVLDAVYNPLRSLLVLSAKSRNIPASGGLYMLVAQAVLAAECFTGKTYGRSQIERIYREMAQEKENIVLIGMPASGKTTVGRRLAKKMGRPFFDSDTEIEKKTGKTPEEIICTQGKDAFREIETEVILTLSRECGAVIATGGGAILKDLNICALKKNGTFFWLNRDPRFLTPTKNRPLSDSYEKMMALYEERLPRYRQVADFEIIPLETTWQTAQEVERRFLQCTFM